MKKIFSKKILAFSITLLVVISNVTSVNAQASLPKLVPPSPSTAALFHFQDYPMDYSTGLPQISIPVYEVTSGSLSVPISMSYHAAGRKVYDQDGPIALGWSLNAGGMISRTIHGTPEFGSFTFPNPLKTDNLTNYNDLAYLQRIMHYQGNNYCGTLYPFYDTEYDIFSYSFGGNSGKFMFKDISNVKTPVWLPYKPFAITVINPGPNFVTFDITDDKGILYKFSAAEFTQLDEYSTTAWNLTSMISADRTDTISFIYTGGVETRKTISQTITYIDNWNSRGKQYPDPPNPSFVENTSQANYQISRISEIRFKQGSVKFNLVNGTSRLANIQILNLNNQLIKTVQLNTSSCYSQVEINNVTNKLDGIEFKDRSNVTTEKYSLEYYPVINSDVNGPVNVRYCDWWGYYNNSSQHDMLPKYTVSAIGFQSTMDIGNPNGNRQPSLEPLKSTVLKKITYPTGGNTEFIYELNKCIINGGDGSVEYGPGLRISQIKSTDGNGINNLRTFKYGINECGYGFLELLPDLSTIKNEITEISFTGSSWIPDIGFGPEFHRERSFYSGIYEELSELAQRPVLYQEVTEYKGTGYSNIGKTIYKYDYTPWAAAGLFPRKHISNYNYWDNPSLILQEDYKNNNAGYQIVKSTSSLYTSTIIENIKGLHVQRAYSIPQDGYGQAYPPGSSTLQTVCSEQFAAYSGQGPVFNGPIPVYSFSPYQVTAGFKNLTQSTETLFTDAGNITTTTSFTYNSKNLLSKKTTSTSKAETLTSDMKYPFDYTGNSLLNQMVSRNMLNYPLEVKDAKNATPVKSVRTNYYDVNGGIGNPMIVPQTIDVSNGSNPYETRLHYYSYDNTGNPTSVGKESDVIHSYVWDYGQLYPIAEVTNATASQIAYTSFEADGAGNWNGINANNIKSDVAGITGNKYYTFSGTTLSKAGLTSSNSYFVSYWSRSGVCTVSGTSASGWPKNLKTLTINGVSWNLWQHKVSGVTSIGVTGAVSIDELRLYPSTSQIVTSTFEPLIGLTSQCDANNKISYYEYDTYGRLKLIRDFNGNILKTLTYKYQSGTP